MSSSISIPAKSLIGSFTPAAFAAHLARVSHLPAWWLDRKRAAYERFAALPFPKRTDEGWRFASLAGIALDGFRSPDAVTLAQTAHREIGVAGAGTLLFANDKLVFSEPISAELAARGLIFDTLQNALLKHGELVRAHLLTQPPKLGSEKFAALHEAFLEDGAFIYVPKKVEVALPLGVFHYAAGQGAAVFPHTLIVADDHAKVTIADFFRSSETGGAALRRDSETAHTFASVSSQGLENRGQIPGGQQAATVQFACGGNDIHVGHGANVTYVAMQDWSREALSFQFNATVVRRDAKVLSVNLHAGARQARHESFSQLQAPGAHSEMLALTIAHGTQEFDQRTLQIHQAPNTSSNLLYKNALLDQTKTIFSGLIVVDPDAQKTDAYQSNRNLMLSADAEANSLPGLEIQANDVRCSHGATSARIDAEQEFYLQSRGIAKAQADELLVFGFFEEVLAKIENQELHDQLATIIRRKFQDN